MTTTVALCVLLSHADSSDREMYAEYLRAQGLDVIETGTTDEAVSQLAGAHVLITGLIVPGSVTPVELIERVRHGSRTTDTPILVLTGSTHRPTLDAAHRAGADVVLIKPCYPNDLLDELHRVLEKRGIREVEEGVYFVPVPDRRSRPRRLSP